MRPISKTALAKVSRLCVGTLSLTFLLAMTPAIFLIYIIVGVVAGAVEGFDLARDEIREARREIRS